ncbi:PREDICTED: arrestin domain-containing protein 3-like [Amphimedon queenslandica]|nr:PREDICTED: arrestin domain-containing protein 3-like [Amphimedon queenslandica]|eukprot:XP_011409241.1 PREDICTED: arrestin domain-containing protein 3-like [Amphimedon queenslandica]
MKDGIFKRDTRCEAYINVGSIVPINNPQLQTPKAMEISKTLCCLCCASGPINITATVPRTGFCILKDAIPIEVSVENGSRRDVRQIVASIHKQVHYTAEGHHRYDNVTVVSVGSEPVAAHSSTVWRPPPIAVPNTPPTLLNCNILQVTYYLTITGSISGAIDPVISIPITIGNVPLEGAPGGFPPQPQGTTAPPPAAGPPPAYPQPPPPTFAPTAPPVGGGFGPPAGGSGFGPPAEFGFGGQQSNFNNFAPVGFSDPPQGIPLHSALSTKKN